MPEPRTIPQRLLLLVGSIGPLGHVPASGTVTVAVVGIPLYWLLSRHSPFLYLGITVAATIAAVVIHQKGDRLLGTEDSGTLVWDEIVGYMIATLFLPFTWQLAVVSFFLERVIDIVKVPPANLIENKVPGGLGVVGDDVVAGLYTLLILQLAVRFAPQWLT